MSRLYAFLKRFERWTLGLLIVIATLFLTYQITRPLIDYDEAIYANVITSTLKSASFITLFDANGPWFEKPPLYFWTTEPIVATFGPQEWTFRAIPITATIICLVLTYLIVRKLTGSAGASMVAFLTLLTAPWFYFLGREARLDSGVLAAILGALLVVISGWRDERYLVLLFPLIAIGFLTKSIIIFLAVPFVVIYCFAYGQWQWLKSTKLWIGSIPGLLILIPWHAWESWKYGSEFWHNYLFINLERTTNTVTGTQGIGDYILPVMHRMPVWFAACAAFVIIFFILSVKSIKHKKFPYLALAAPLACATLVFVFFTTARTHLAAYVLPAYPFIAMFIAQSTHKINSLGRRGVVIALLAVVLIVSGAYYCLSIPWTAFQDEGRFINDEMHIGEIYRQQAPPNAGMYSFLWGGLDTINFYSGTKVVYTDATAEFPMTAKAPFYFLMTIPNAEFLLSKVPGAILSMKVLFQGQYLILFYSASNMTLGS